MFEESTLRPDLILEIIHGSRAYGTHRPDSDTDIKGIVLLRQPAAYFGFERFEQKDSGWADNVDRVWYDLRKFCRLALQCNPNIIEMLWVPDGCKLLETQVGRELISLRERFLSTAVFRSFGGYAHDQQKKLEHKAASGEPIKWKHALHLVRLSRMAHEIATTGQIMVQRPDAEELKEIGAGKWTFERVLSEVERLRNASRQLESASKLPEKPDRAGIEAWLVNVIWQHLDSPMSSWTDSSGRPYL